MILDALQEHLNTQNEQDLCVLNDAELPDTLTKFFEEQLAGIFRVSHVALNSWALQ